ncbi:MAG: nucleotidyltransferase domain-containing protein [Clostridia bacterium]|nr:nucleotidyltransferase domain-containing protein [Clostridia bacterium]
MATLREIRVEKKLTQKEASEYLGVSLRSYKMYENEEEKKNVIKYKYMIEQLEKYIELDEEHGILSLEEIKKACGTVFQEYNVKYCILFGSYAKGKAKETSDVDLLISTDAKGLKFFGMAERLRQELHKKVDLLDFNQLPGNEELIEEILKDGIRIYG